MKKQRIGAIVAIPVHLAIFTSFAALLGFILPSRLELFDCPAIITWHGVKFSVFMTFNGFIMSWFFLLIALAYWEDPESIERRIRMNSEQKGCRIDPVDLTPISPKTYRITRRTIALVLVALWLIPFLALALSGQFQRLSIWHLFLFLEIATFLLAEKVSSIIGFNLIYGSERNERPNES